MPRSGLDQALITGISTSLNYAFAALIQDSIEAVALRGAGRTDPARVDRHTWRRASIGLDLAAIGAGLAAQSALRPRPGERLPRGGARTAAWWLSATGLSGAVIGTLQELTRRRDDTQDHSIPVAPFAGAARPRSTTTDAGAGRPSSLGWGPTRAPRRRRPSPSP
jgi:hypothetical protein